METYADVSKNRGNTPKMDGLFHGNLIKMDDLEGFPPLFSERPHTLTISMATKKIDLFQSAQLGSLFFLSQPPEGMV